LNKHTQGEDYFSESPRTANSGFAKKGSVYNSQKKKEGARRWLYRGGRKITPRFQSEGPIFKTIFKIGGEGELGGVAESCF